MRYALAAITILILVTATWALTTFRGRDNTSAHTPGDIGANRTDVAPAATATTVPITATATAIPVTATATTAVATAIPDIEVGISRDDVLLRARGTARSMGEADPQLVDVSLVRAGGALQVIGDIGEHPWLDRTKPVYLVRMQGTFTPDRQEFGANTKFTGWMYQITDASNGQPIGSGIKLGTSPSIPARLLLREAP